jgi:hypothetical protein
MLASSSSGSPTLARYRRGSAAGLSWDSSAPSKGAAWKAVGGGVPGGVSGVVARSERVIVSVEVREVGRVGWDGEREEEAWSSLRILEGREEGSASSRFSFANRLCVSSS